MAANYGRTTSYRQGTQTGRTSYARNPYTGSVNGRSAYTQASYTKAAGARTTTANARYTAAGARTTAANARYTAAGARTTAANARYTAAGARTATTRTMGASNASGRRTASYGMANERNMGYVDGSAAHKYAYYTDPQFETSPRKEISRQTKKNREKATKMHISEVLFFAAALCVLCAFLYGYLALQTQNTAAATEIASMEKQLNQLKLENDEYYSRIMSSVSMEEIKEKAIGQLGMQYAQEGQIVKIGRTNDDYVRQYKAIE